MFLRHKNKQFFILGRHRPVFCKVVCAFYIFEFRRDEWSPLSSVVPPDPTAGYFTVVTVSQRRVREGTVPSCPDMALVSAGPGRGAAPGPLPFGPSHRDRWISAPCCPSWVTPCLLGTGHGIARNMKNTEKLPKPQIPPLNALRPSSRLSASAAAGHAEVSVPTRRPSLWLCGAASQPCCYLALSPGRLSSGTTFLVLSPSSRRGRTRVSSGQDVARGADSGQMSPSVFRRAASPGSGPWGREGLRSARRADPLFHPGRFRRPRSGCCFTLWLSVTLISPPPRQHQLCVRLLVRATCVCVGSFLIWGLCLFPLGLGWRSLVWR